MQNRPLGCDYTIINKCTTHLRAWWLWLQPRSPSSHLMHSHLNMV